MFSVTWTVFCSGHHGTWKPLYVMAGTERWHCFLLLITLQCTLGTTVGKTDTLWAPSKRLPGYERGCVQGAEVMGGSFAQLPPCAPWKDDRGRCHVGDTILLRAQCLDILTLEEYDAMPQRRPQPLPLSRPPSPPSAQNIVARPSGWGEGNPPGNWPQSRPPGTPIGLPGPPGTNPVKIPEDEEILPPGEKNYRWALKRSSFGRRSRGSVSGRRNSKRGKGIVGRYYRAPAPAASLINKSGRTTRRRNRKRDGALRKRTWLRSNRRARRFRARKQRRRRRRQKRVTEKLEAPPK